MTVWFLDGPLLFLPALLALVSELVPSKANLETAGSITVVAFLLFWVLGAGFIAVLQPYRRRRSARRQEDADHAAAGLERVGARPPLWAPTVLARFWMRSRANWCAPVKSEAASQVLVAAAIFATFAGSVMGVMLYGWWRHSEQVHPGPHWVGVVVQVLGSLLVPPIALSWMVEVGSQMWQGAGKAFALRNPTEKATDRAPRGQARWQWPRDDQDAATLLAGSQKRLCPGPRTCPEWGALREVEQVLTSRFRLPAANRTGHADVVGAINIL